MANLNIPRETHRGHRGNKINNNNSLYKQPHKITLREIIEKHTFAIYEYSQIKVGKILDDLGEDLEKYYNKTTYNRIMLDDEKPIKHEKKFHTRLNSIVYISKVSRLHNFTEIKIYIE